MIGSYHEIREALMKIGGNVDMRTAAFSVAINKIGISYEELGIFP
jgi:glutamate dehydrogenase (NAD(P)+)